MKDLATIISKDELFTDILQHVDAINKLLRQTKSVSIILGVEDQVKSLHPETIVDALGIIDDHLDKIEKEHDSLYDLLKKNLHSKAA